MGKKTKAPKVTIPIKDIRKRSLPNIAAIVNPLLKREGEKARQGKTSKKRVSLNGARESASQALQIEVSIKGLTEQGERLVAQVLAYQLQQGVIDFYFNPEDPEDRYHLTETEKVELEQTELERKVSASVWKQITDSVRVVNPWRLEQALKQGILTSRVLKRTIKVSVSIDARYQRPKVKAAKKAKKTKSSKGVR